MVTLKKYSYESQKEAMELLNIDAAEFAAVVSEINKNFRAYKLKKTIIYYTPEFIYKVRHHGFNNYEFYDKIINDDTRKDWG